jgi:hypothetical protein
MTSRVSKHCLWKRIASGEGHTGIKVAMNLRWLSKEQWQCKWLVDYTRTTLRPRYTAVVIMSPSNITCLMSCQFLWNILEHRTVIQYPLLHDADTEGRAHYPLWTGVCFCFSNLVILLFIQQNLTITPFLHRLQSEIYLKAYAPT